MDGVINLAAERLQRSDCAGLHYPVILESIALAIREWYPDREAQIEALTSYLTISINLETGMVSIRPRSN